MPADAHNDASETEQLARALSEQRRLQLENQTLAQERDDARQELARFVYIASHDLRAPLRAITSLVEWITEDLGEEVSDETRDHLRLLRVRAGRMDAYLVALLEYSRVGRIVDPVERIDARELLLNVIDGLDAPASMQIEVSVADDVPSFESGKAGLHRVLHHLVQNAVVHHDAAAGKVEVRVTRAGEQLYFEVCDDGPGIPPKLHAKAFDIFQTLSRRDDDGGCGMGLPIAKKLVESAGGAMELLIRRPWHHRALQLAAREASSLR